MDNDKKPANAPAKEQDVPEIDINAKPRRQVIDERVDEELDQTFPASDPPSYSTPGNDDIKPGKQDIKESKESGA